MKKNFLTGALIFVIALAFIFSFTACKGKGKVNVDYYVYEPSCQLDSDGKPQSLVVQFDGSVCKLEEAGGQPSAEITISPSISGKWFWTTDSLLKFEPSENWLLNTRYKVSMPASIFAEHVNVKTDFSFKTELFEAYRGDSEFYINPENPEEKRVTATIKTSHPMQKDTFPELVSMTFEYLDSKGKTSKSENWNFKVNFSKNAMEAYLVSDVLPIPPYTSRMKISVKKGIQAQTGGKADYDETFYIDVPGMSDFVDIEDVSTSLVKNASQNYDQMLVIETKGQVSIEELAEHITVYELPKDKPELEGWKGVEDCQWYSDMVTDKVLELSRKISLKGVPTPEPASSLNSFVFKATQGRYIYVKIEGDLDFFGGYKLRFDNEFNSYEECLKVPIYPRELAIMSEGTILSLSGSKKMALYSRGVDKVYYRLSRIMPKDVNHLVSMSNGNMKNFRFDNYNFNENNIAESETSSFNVPNFSSSEISYFSYDFSNKLAANSSKNLKNGLFLFQVSDNKDSLGRNDYYYSSSLTDKRLILVTDLGFVVKRNTDGSRDIFVQSISSGN
ncbi:MAG: hypothetical protein K5839_00375, partial [Treponemataceae bacterium]|nr:hypothetical protein [Treponemataceae bacterium]